MAALRGDDRNHPALAKLEEESVNPLMNKVTLIIFDITNVFTRDDVKFDIFKKLVKSGSVVRAIPGVNCGSRSIADKMNAWAQQQGNTGRARLKHTPCHTSRARSI